MSEISRLLILIGGVRDGRFGPVVASWVADRPRARCLRGRPLDLAEVELPVALPAESPKMAGEAYPRPAGMADLTARLDAADAFVLVTPEYNHSYPASLKAAIDWHFTQWKAKPVAFVSYGGAAGGRHAVLHLENVLTELHAVTIREGLAFPSYWANFEDGRRRPAGTGVRQGHARATRLVGQRAAQGPLRVRLPRLNRHGENHRIRPRRHRHRRVHVLARPHVLPRTRHAKPTRPDASRWPSSVLRNGQLTCSVTGILF